LPGAEEVAEPVTVVIVHLISLILAVFAVDDGALFGRHMLHLSHHLNHELALLLQHLRLEVYLFMHGLHAVCHVDHLLLDQLVDGILF
jgi:hypothetical protein